MKDQIVVWVQLGVTYVRKNEKKYINTSVRYTSYKEEILLSSWRLGLKTKIW